MRFRIYKRFRIFAPGIMIVSKKISLTRSGQGRAVKSFCIKPNLQFEFILSLKNNMAKGSWRNRILHCFNTKHVLQKNIIFSWENDSTKFIQMQFKSNTHSLHFNVYLTVPFPLRAQNSDPKQS